MADIPLKNKKGSNELRVSPDGTMVVGQKHEMLYLVIFPHRFTAKWGRREWGQKAYFIETNAV